MDYSQYTLSVGSSYLPEIGECNTCPFVNKCHDGEKCLISKDSSKFRDRSAYYQAHKEAYKETARLQRLRLKGEII